jgi:type I restriction enzyme S subunit
MGHIKREDIDNSKVLVPSAARLIDRSNLMDSLLDKIINNFKHIESLLEQRDRLLPKLMSGELRVDLNGRSNETKQLQ